MRKENTRFGTINLNGVIDFFQDARFCRFGLNHYQWLQNVDPASRHTEQPALCPTNPHLIKSFIFDFEVEKDDTRTTSD